MDLDIGGLTGGGASFSCFGISAEAWDRAGFVQQVANYIFSALDNVQAFVGSLTFVPDLLTSISGSLRVFSIVVIGFHLKSLRDKCLALVKGEDGAGNKLSRPLTFVDAISDIGNIMDDFSTIVSAIGKMTKVAAVVNAVAQWIGFAGVLLQAAEVPIQSYLIHKGVKILKAGNSNDLSPITKCAEKVHLTAVTKLTETQVNDISGKVGAFDHIKKRINYDIAIRAIGITFAVLSVVSICLTTFGVGAVLVGIGLGLTAFMAASQLLLIPIKEIVDYAFDREYNLIKEGV